MTEKQQQAMSTFKELTEGWDDEIYGVDEKSKYCETKRKVATGLY